MARYKVIIQEKGLRKKALVEKLAHVFSEPHQRVRVNREELPVSRVDRFQHAKALVEEAKDEIESLRDEMQEWFDNLPENFQVGEKGETLEEAVQELEGMIGSLEEAEYVEVEFPGMFG